MATTPKIDKSALNDPYYKDFLTRAQNDFGLDPNQELDLNDPWTKLSMTIILTSLEQGRDNYSYDQYVKGIAKSIGANSDDYDKFIQNVSGSKSTQLGFENGSGTTGFVSPATNSVTKGGSSISITASIPYSSVAIQGALSDIKIGAVNPLGGITNYITSATSGITNAVNSVVNTVTGAFTNTGTTQGASTINVVGSAIGGTGGTVLVFAGTNNYTSTGNLPSDIKAIGDAIVAKGGTPVFVAPAPNINNIGNNNAQDAVIAGARDAGYQVITPPPGSFNVVRDASGRIVENYHLTGAACQNIAIQAASLTGQKVVMANGDSNALACQAKIGVSGTATVGIGTGQILTDVSSKMPVIGTQLLPDNFYSSINQPAGASAPAASPVVATTPTPTTDQVAVDQAYFNEGMGAKAGDKVVVNGHTYTVGSNGETLIPAVAPSSGGKVPDIISSTRTLDTAPTNAEVGMPENSVVSISKNNDGTFQKATYTDPTTGLSKTIGADGTITLTGGGKTETVGNYFGNQTAVTEPPTAQQAGLPDGTQTLATYDTSGKLVGVTYVTSPPSVADLQNQYRDILDKKAPLEAEYDRLNATGDIAAADAAFEKLTPYYKQLDSLKTQIENGPVGTTYSLNVQTGKLTNDGTGEVSGTVSTKVDNSAALSQYNSLQQQKESLDAEAASRQGTDNPMSAGEYLSRSSEINQQITALGKVDIPNSAGASEVQVASLNTGIVNDASNPIITSQDSLNQINVQPVARPTGTELSSIGGVAREDTIAQPGYNTGNSPINGTALDPTTRELGTPAATTAPNTISIDPSTGLITGRVSTNNPYYGLDGANSDPNNFGDTNKPTIIVDDPKAISVTELPGSVTGTNLVSIDANTGNMTGVVQTTDPNAYLDATVSGNQAVNMTVAYDPNLGLELGQQGPYTANMTLQNTNNPSEFYSQVDVMPSGGRGAGNTILETPGERASYQAPASTDSNGTSTPGSDSVAGSTTPSSPGSPVTSAGSAAMGGGGC